jgi:hypothetical protein
LSNTLGRGEKSRKDERRKKEYFLTISFKTFIVFIKVKNKSNKYNHKNSTDKY